jgi:hypothetical protein
MFFGVAQIASADMSGRDRNTWLDFIQAEYDYFKEALDCYAKASAGQELELASNLGLFWTERGFWTEGREGYGMLWRDRRQETRR